MRASGGPQSPRAEILQALKSLEGPMEDGCPSCPSCPALAAQPKDERGRDPRSSLAFPAGNASRAPPAVGSASPAHWKGRDESVHERPLMHGVGGAEQQLLPWEMTFFAEVLLFFYS